MQIGKNPGNFVPAEVKGHPEVDFSVSEAGADLWNLTLQGRVPPTCRGNQFGAGAGAGDLGRKCSQYRWKEYRERGVFGSELTRERPLNDSRNLDLKFLRMSDYPQKQQQSGKFVLSQQNQQRQHPPPPPSPLAAAAAGVIHQRRHPQHLSQQNSPLHRREGRRPLASNYCWSSSSNVAGNVPTPTPTAAPAAAAGSFHCYYPDVDGAADLGDDTLKSNVQIVLDNINRNYHALREQILNNHHQLA